MGRQRQPSLMMPCKILFVIWAPCALRSSVCHTVELRNASKSFTHDGKRE